jgi:hypothetical protein
VRPSGLTTDKARLIVDPKSPTIECKILDMSAGGACLEIAGRPTLPKRFVLVHGATKKKCSLVWKSGIRIGITF